MPRLSELPNIGPELEKQLMAVGINTPEELREVGSCEAWLRILRQDPSACMMRLSALEAQFRALGGTIWMPTKACSRSSTTSTKVRSSREKRRSHYHISSPRGC